MLKQPTYPSPSAQLSFISCSRFGGLGGQQLGKVQPGLASVTAGRKHRYEIVFYLFPKYLYICLHRCMPPSLDSCCANRWTDVRWCLRVSILNLFSHTPSPMFKCCVLLPHTCLPASFFPLTLLLPLPLHSPSSTLPPSFPETLKLIKTECTHNVTLHCV